MWFVWMAFGFFTCFVVQSFNKYIKAKGISLKWYGWTVFGFWYALVFLTIDIIVLSMMEGEPRAAAIMGIGLAAVCLVLLPLLRKMLDSSKISPDSLGKRSEVL